jgi:Mat/Ecp fimbriae outer membrane usher protein
VSINGNPRGTAFTGESQPIFLEPYRKYRVKVVPQNKADFVAFDASEKSVILFPGTVRTLTWEITKITVIFGRIVDSNGKPLVNQTIRGVVGVAETDANGNFQAEIRGSTPKLVIKRADGSSCTVALSGLKPVNGYTKIGNVTCR